jgi:hypothetical protein
MDLYTGKMDALWIGQLWMVTVPRSFSAFEADPTRDQFRPQNNQALKGHAITYFAEQEAYGRRRTVDAVEEFDILIPLDSECFSSGWWQVRRTG